MKKHLPYIIAFAIIVLGGSAYYLNSDNKNSNSAIDSTTGMNHDMTSMNQSDTSVDQSHRSYDVQITSSTNKIKPNQTTKVSFKIINDKKEVVKDFTIAHEKLMHFILVRKDLQNFQHLHPDFNQQTGEFAVNITFPADGPYRLFPDFTPTSENPQKLPVTVSFDMNVGNQAEYKPQTVIADTEIVKKVGSYRVDYYFPESPLKSQSQIDYSLSIGLPDEVVTLDPYLGSMGHGVIIKEDTLDFIHTHAISMDMEAMEGMTSAEHAGHMPEPGNIDFSATFPEPGTYKIFTQFQVKGKVITSDYVIKVD